MKQFCLKYTLHQDKWSCTVAKASRQHLFWNNAKSLYCSLYINYSLRKIKAEISAITSPTAFQILKRCKRNTCCAHSPSSGFLFLLLFHSLAETDKYIHTSMWNYVYQSHLFLRYLTTWNPARRRASDRLCALFGGELRGRVWLLAAFDSNARARAFSPWVHMESRERR